MDGHGHGRGQAKEDVIKPPRMVAMSEVLAFRRDTQIPTQRQEDQRKTNTHQSPPRPARLPELPQGQHAVQRMSDTRNSFSMAQTRHRQDSVFNTTKPATRQCDPALKGAQFALEQAAINEAFLRRSEHSIFELHCLVNRVAESQQKQEREWQASAIKAANQQASAARKWLGRLPKVRQPSHHHARAGASRRSQSEPIPMTDTLTEDELSKEASSDHPGHPRKAYSKITLSSVNSVMLQMGLKFDLYLPGPRDHIAAVSESPAHALITHDGGRGSPSLGDMLTAMNWQPESMDDGLSDSDNDEDEDCSMYELAKMRRKVANRERIQNLLGFIARRDMIRALSKKMLAEQPRMRELALRAAMWLTIASLVSRDFWEAPRRKHMQIFIQNHVIPLWRKKARLRSRRAWEKFCAWLGKARSPRPTINQLRSPGMGGVFETWPDDSLNSIIRKMTPMRFVRGQCIFHQGDPPTYLYILLRGKVEIITKGKGKGRGKKSGVVVRTMEAPCLFGIFAVFSGEPRLATVHCAESVDCWLLQGAAFQWQLHLLPGQAQQKCIKTIEDAMARCSGGSANIPLGSVPLFAGWTVDVLREIESKLEPVVFTKGQIMLRQGDAGTCILFLSKGRAEATTLDDDGNVVRESNILPLPVTAIGVRSCLFLETQDATVIARSVVQVGRMTKQMFMGYMLQRADLLLAAKDRMNRICEADLLKPKLQQLMTCGLFGQGFPSRLGDHILEHLLRARVVQARVPFVEEGRRVAAVYLLTWGSCEHQGRRYGRGDTIGVEEIIEKKTARWPKPVLTIGRVDAWALCLQDLQELLDSHEWAESRNAAVQVLKEHLSAYPDVGLPSEFVVMPGKGARKASRAKVPVQR
mmetsp:Transcript_38793/g.69414  ORF Transcript_38793/g.69414 Transcript_38793/m.69414 type:complete len:867 (-) Transcript_38793:154-2754(-)